MDNFFKQCPPVMSDGRFLTDWRTNVRMNEAIKFDNNVVRDDDYRLFLEDNADTVMDTQWDYLRKNKSCWVNECVHNYPLRMYPKWFSQEMKAYNSLQTGNRKNFYPCPKFKDYRLTQTPGSRLC